MQQQNNLYIRIQKRLLHLVHRKLFVNTFIIFLIFQTLEAFQQLIEFLFVLSVLQSSHLISFCFLPQISFFLNSFVCKFSEEELATTSFKFYYDVKTNESATILCISEVHHMSSISSKFKEDSYKRIAVIYKLLNEPSLFKPPSIQNFCHSRNQIVLLYICICIIFGLNFIFHNNRQNFSTKLENRLKFCLNLFVLNY